MKRQEHKIAGVVKKSIAQAYGIEAGDVLISINHTVPEDVFDYQYQMQNEEITLEIRSKEDGSVVEVTIQKEPDEDLGIVFDNGLMDEYHSCSNHCIFALSIRCRLE